jgi:hypothetical protein
VLKCDSSISRCCQLFVDKIVARCSVASQVPPLDDLLAAQYDCSSVLPAFDSCLLSPLAFRVARHELGTANVAELPCICGRTRHAPPNVLHDIAMPLCNSCLRSLLRRPSTANAPPLFAIANGFAIGRLPSSLSDVTVHEEAMVSPVFPSGKSRQASRVDRQTKYGARTMIPSAREQGFHSGIFDAAIGTLSFTHGQAPCAVEACVQVPIRNI